MSKSSGLLKMLKPERIRNLKRPQSFFLKNRKRYESNFSKGCRRGRAERHYQGHFRRLCTKFPHTERARRAGDCRKDNCAPKSAGTRDGDAGKRSGGSGDVRKIA